MKQMNLIDKVFILKSSDLFSQVDLDLLLPIADKFSTLEYQANETIFNINESARRLYLIVKGSVLVKDEQGTLLDTLYAPDFFGDEAIFNEQQHSYQAEAAAPTILLGLSHTNLLTIIYECPQVAIGLLQAYSLAIPFRVRADPTK